MKTIAISNLKGGVGKTTSAANLAYCLSQRGQHVLVIDADPQSNLTPFFVKANQQGETLLTMLQSPAKINSCIRRSRYENIDIIKGNSEITESMVTDPNCIADALGHLTRSYDYCIIDTRPVFENLTQAAVNASDMVLTPVFLDKFCRDNLALVEEQLDKLAELTGHRPEWYIFANKVASNRKAQRKVYEDLMGRHDYPFLATCISSTADIGNALDLYKPVTKHRRNSVAALDYEELASEIYQLMPDSKDQ